MACDLESLNHLEALLTEFYSAIADNARKKEIDKILTDFCGQPASWKSCLFYMSNTRNDHVLMFCLKVIEIAVSRQGITFGSGDKEMIRINCYQMLMSDKDLSFFIRNKMMKLIVIIARFDWPQNYPSFLDEINHLLSLEDHVLLGLNFLVVASEEFSSTKEDISSGRKRQLTEVFKSNIPILLNKVAGVLQEVRIKIDALQPDGLSLTNGVPCRRSCCVEEKWSNILRSGLECIVGLLNWFEPQRTEEESAFLQSLFSSIVELATTFLVSHEGLHCCPSQCRFQIAEMALGCICEVLSMKLCSKLFNLRMFPYFVANSHERIRNVLRVFVNESHNIWSYLNEGRYLTKMVDFLHLFIKNHLKDVEADQEFFQILIKFTFEQQPYTSLYVSCLSMWMDFFEYLANQKSRFPETSSRFKDISLEVAAKVLTSIQFKHNQSHLESLDDDVLDDDFRTEWQNYLLENTEVILKVAKLYHTEVLLYLNQPFEEALRTYFGLGGYVMTVQNGSEGPLHPSVRQSRRFVITAENDCKKLHCMLRDLSTFLRIFAALADDFVCASSQEDLETGCILFQRLLGLMDYSSKMRFHEVDSAIKSVLESDFIEVHAESLAAVKAWCPFLSRVKSDPSKLASLGIDCNEMVSSIFYSLLPLLQTELIPEKILLSASQLLLSFVVEIKPPLIDSSFHCLFSNGIRMASAPPKALILTYRALFLNLLSSLPPQKVDDRTCRHKDLLRVFCDFLFKDFSSVYEEISRSAGGSRSFADDESANAVVQRTMEVVTEVVLGVDGMSSKKSDVCYDCLVLHIKRTVDVLHVFIDRKDTSCKMMGFFFAIIQTFRSQMGVELVRSVLDRFVVIFSGKLVMDSLKEEDSSGHELIEKLLQIFEVLVKDGSPQSRNFLPNILELCLDKIHVVVADRPSPGVKPCLFNLFFSTLKSNWSLFFPSNLLLHNNNNDTLKLLNNKNQLNPELQARYQEYFALMMRAYDASLSQSDVELARQILDQLETLNKQFKMYSKPSFREQFLPRFLFLLTSILIHRVHDLLREEVLTAVFNMAAVDFGFFYKNFIPQLLASCPLNEEYSRFLVQGLTATDESLTFSSKMQSFVADLRFFLNETAFNSAVLGPSL